MFFGKKSGAVSWLLVFLGNPGEKYKNTRHNAGFMAADVLASDLGVKIDRLRFSSLTRAVTLGGESVLLMKPQTYMNLSGGAAREAMRFYKVPPERLIAVSDDISLLLGKLRVRRSGSAGGHNGLKDIIAKCGGEGFPRVKIGVGAPPHPEYDMKDWVLSGFYGRDLDVITGAVRLAADATLDIIERGVDYAMSRYN